MHESLGVLCFIVWLYYILVDWSFKKLILWEIICAMHFVCNQSSPQTPSNLSFPLPTQLQFLLFLKTHWVLLCCSYWLGDHPAQCGPYIGATYLKKTGSLSPSGYELPIAPQPGVDTHLPSPGWIVCMARACTAQMLYIVSQPLCVHICNSPVVLRQHCVLVVISPSGDYNLPSLLHWSLRLGGRECVVNVWLELSAHGLLFSAEKGFSDEGGDTH